MKTKSSKGSNAQTSATATAACYHKHVLSSDSASLEECTDFATTSNDTQSLKNEIQTLLRKDLAEIFRSELQSMLGDDLATIKSEIQAVKVEFSNSMVFDAVGQVDTEKYSEGHGTLAFHLFR